MGAYEVSKRVRLENASFDSVGGSAIAVVGSSFGRGLLVFLFVFCAGFQQRRSCPLRHGQSEGRKKKNVTPSR